MSDEVSVWIAAKPWRNRLAGFRSPASLSTPRWRPKLASLLEVVALRQLALPEVAPQRKRYLRLERERLTSIGNPMDLGAVGRDSD